MACGHASRFCLECLLAAACVAGMACGLERGGRPQDEPGIERAEGRRWGERMRLVEDMRIGALEAGRSTAPTFGLIDELAPDERGGVAVVDAHGPWVLRFDAQGALRDSVGRRGEGPGEYQEVAGLAWLADGRLLVLEPRRGLLTFDADGSFLGQWSIRTNLVGERPLVVDRDGNLALRFVVRHPGPANPYGAPNVAFMRISAGGRVLDTIAVPAPSAQAFNGVVEFTPEEFAVWHPKGVMIVARNVDYELLFVDLDGSVQRSIRRPFEPVALKQDEWEAWNRGNEWRRSRGLRNPDAIPPIPRVKPAFKEVLVARTGEIWVQRHGEAVRVGADAGNVYPYLTWRERAIFDVFSEDGVFLSEIEGPLGLSMRAASGDTVWGVARGAYGEGYVVRLLVRSEE